MSNFRIWKAIILAEPTIRKSRLQLDAIITADMKLRCCALLQRLLLNFFFLLFHKAVACSLLRWWLLTTFFLLFPDAAAGFVLQWCLRLCFCWCVAGVYFCAWAVPGVLFLQGHQLCRAPSPFCSGGWSYKAYCVFCPCPAKPASGGSAGVHAPFWNVAWAAPPAARSASAGSSGA